MYMKYFLGVDTETGGISEETSLLTAYYGFYQLNNSKFTLLDDLDLKIKPNDGIYRVTSEGMNVNKINLIEHDKIAIYEKFAGQQLYKKLQEWFVISKDKIVPVGHNVYFDINRTTDRLISKGSWETFVSYRAMDTCTLAQFYRICGKLPADISCSLSHLAGYYKVQVTGKHHEAKCDVEMTMGVLENLIKNA